MNRSILAVATPAAGLAGERRRAIASLAAALGILWLAAVAAHAQGYDRPERIDRPEDKTSSDKDFTFGVDLGLRRSSSVTSASADSIVEDRPDSHVTPDFYLKWSRQYDGFKASMEVGASLDRYFNTSDGNLDSLRSSFKIAKTDGKWEYFVPYFSISNDMYFLPTFREPDLTFSDAAVGFYSAVGWRDKQLIPYKDSLVPYSDASEPGDVTLLFDARVGRRMSDTTRYQNTFVLARLTAAYYIAANWRVEAMSAFRARWYEDYDGEKRTDLRPSASVGVFWTPDWLKRIVKRSEISLNLEYYRNFSNIAEKSYSLWEVGPTLSLRTKF